MVDFKICIEATIGELISHATDGSGGFANYRAVVSLCDHQGFDRFGEPVEIRHTFYFNGDGETLAPEDLLAGRKIPCFRTLLAAKDWCAGNEVIMSHRDIYKE